MSDPIVGEKVRLEAEAKRLELELAKVRRRIKALAAALDDEAGGASRSVAGFIETTGGAVSIEEVREYLGPGYTRREVANALGRGVRAGWLKREGARRYSALRTPFGGA